MTLTGFVATLSIIAFLPTLKVAGRCLSRTAVGLERGKIPDYAMTSSSNAYCCNILFCSSCHEATFSRLHGPDVWQSTDNYPNGWIQIDLGSSMTVTKVATQGRKNVNYQQWVKSYVLSFSQDGSSFQSYKYNKGEVIKANSDRNTVADHVLQPPITARYIKLLPKEFYGKPSMRMELYTGQCSAVNYYMAIPHQSCDQACKSHDQVCLDIDHGLSRTYNAKTIIESLIGHTCLTGFTKTDSYSNGAHPIYKPNQRCVGWKNVPEKINCALWWPNVDGLRLCPCNKVKHARICQNTVGHLQCMNGRAIKVVSANFGRTEYDVCPHADIKSTDCRDSLSMKIVSDKCQGKSYCEVWSSTATMGSDPCPSTHKYLQVEYECTSAIKQAFVRAHICNAPLGLENGTISDSDMTASSFYGAGYQSHFGRMNLLQIPGVTAGAWCTLTNDLQQYLQVDFRKGFNVSKVATQGWQHKDEWVESFSLSYSHNNETYARYKQAEQEVVFTGNTDRNTIVSHSLNPPIVARFIRIHPKSWHLWICLRAEFYGCATAPSCVGQYCKSCKRSVPFRKTKSGALLSGHVIGKFQAPNEIVCQLYCLRNHYCVSFNLGPPRTPLRECEISDSDHVQNPKDIVSREGYDYYGIENACSSGPCPNNASCQADFDKNTFRCVCPLGFTGKFCTEDIDECSTHTHDCDPGANCTNTAGSYNCTCREEFVGNGKTCYVPETCTDILEYNSSASSGPYYLKRKGGEPQLVYCHMEELPGCSGRGWTMVMKINGTKSTFKFSSPHWSDNSTVNEEAGRNDLKVHEETKMHTYWSTPLTRLCVGTWWSGRFTWLEIKQSSSSLLQVLAGSPYRVSTTVGRAAWLSLLKGSALQDNCNREGFNVVPDSNYIERVKIGVLGNDDFDCASINSYLGFGTPSSGCGNRGRYLGFNIGDVDINPFCYIFLK